LLLSKSVEERPEEERNDDGSKCSEFVFGEHDHAVTETEDKVVIAARDFEADENLAPALGTVPAVFGEAITKEEESDSQLDGVEQNEYLHNDEGQTLHGFRGGLKMAYLAGRHLLLAQRLL
jgi:hypothetical protein